MTKEQYASKMEKILQLNQFKLWKTTRSNALPPNIKTDEHFERLLDEAKKTNGILHELFENFSSVSSQPAKLYTLPKIHKEDVPMRPILSTVGTMNHAVAQRLDRIIKPLINNDYVCTDSFSFVDSITKLKPSSEENTMVSFDVKSLFTMVPLEETIKICSDLFSEKYGPADKTLFEKLLSLCVKDVHFLYNDQWWQQTDGVSMGSPLAPTLANVFMSHLEKSIAHYSGASPKFYTRYVDDIFMIFNSKGDIEPFFNFMNNLHRNIEFTKEEEELCRLPFLDVMVERSINSYTTGQFFKKTDTGLYTTPFSECDSRYRDNLVQGLITRAYRLGSSFKNIVSDIETNKQRLIKCGYNENDIDHIIKKTVEKEYRQHKKESSDKETISAVFPYGNGHKTLRKGLANVVKQNDTEDKFSLRVIFKTLKISSYFSNKCRTPKALVPNIVYRFQCQGCDARYIGESMRHLRTRCQEHGQRSRKSAIYDHLLICDKRTEKISPDEFTIMVKNANIYRTKKIHEALLIKNQKPQINQQKEDFGITLKLFT